MNARANRSGVRRPWHLWLVAIAMFALYVGGARDYLLILVQSSDYIRGQFGPDGLTYFADYPFVLRIVWTINILGGLIAPVLLVLRHRWALAAALVATAAQVALLVTTFAFLDRWAMLGAATSWFDIGVGVATALLAAYCWAVRRRGHLA
ncbi:hypothetical protein LY13_001066 [Prauserella aidingensis]|uniref:hypothetical protein n=1 Tax=Prauserella aidingensis TaxID=387890 RepID=UPI0020A4E5A1|nr:hypothetical protein [Prauserella aidingensis]MCP2252327.1 hypothetical protein [Prauserella aidingensis]